MVSGGIVARFCDFGQSLAAMFIVQSSLVLRFVEISCVLQILSKKWKIQTPIQDNLRNQSLEQNG